MQGLTGRRGIAGVNREETERRALQGLTGRRGIAGGKQGGEEYCIVLIIIAGANREERNIALLKKLTGQVKGVR